MTRRLGDVTSAAATADPWTWLHDNDFSWDDTNAFAAVLGAGGYEIIKGGTTTRCPLGGVHEHPFRGPHMFHEWDPTLCDHPTSARVFDSMGWSCSRCEQFIETDDPGNPPYPERGRPSPADPPTGSSHTNPTVASQAASG